MHVTKGNEQHRGEVAATAANTCEQTPTCQNLSDCQNLSVRMTMGERGDAHRFLSGNVASTCRTGAEPPAGGSRAAGGVTTRARKAQALVVTPPAAREPPAGRGVGRAHGGLASIIVERSTTPTSGKHSQAGSPRSPWAVGYRSTRAYHWGSLHH